MHINNINYCYKCGANIKHGNSNIKTCPKCGKTFYSYGVPSVAVLLANSRKEILFIQRANDPDKGKLDFPGAFIRFSETAEETAQRVLQQELNIKNKDIKLNCIGTSINDYGKDENKIRIITILFKGSISVDVSKEMKPGGDAQEIIFYKSKDIKITNLAYKNMLDEIKLMRNL